MSFTKFCEVLLFLLILCSVSDGAEEVQRVHIKGLRCNVSEDYLYPNVSCFPKSYSRNLSTVNLIATVKKPLTDIFVLVKLIYKYGARYREVMHTPRFDWCHMMENYDKNDVINSPLKQILKVLEDSAPSIFHVCPFTEFIVRNASVKTASVMSLFPSGDYKMVFDITDKKESSVAHVTIIGSLLSPNKDTFG